MDLSSVKPPIQIRLEKWFYLSFMVFLFAFISWILVRSNKSAYLYLFAIVVTAICLCRFCKPAKECGYLYRFDDLISRFRRLVNAISIGAILWTAFLLRFLWGIYYGSIPFADFDLFYKHSVEFASGDISILGTSKTPVSIIYYGTILAIFGKSLFFIYLVNAICGVFQTCLVYWISRNLFLSRSAAKFSALCIAICPSIVMFSCVVSSEMPFTTIMLILLWLTSKIFRVYENRSWKRLAVYGGLLGVVTAMLHMTRNLGVIIGLWLLVTLIAFAKFDKKKVVALSVSFFLLLVIFLTPQIIYNYEKYKIFSIHSSQWGSIILLHGTNRETRGAWSTECIDRVRNKHQLSGETFLVATEYARKLAIDSIMEDPLDFVQFALTKKFTKMWCEDGYGPFWSIRDSKHRPKNKKPVNKFKVHYTIKPDLELWRKVCNHYYALLAFLILLALCAISFKRDFNRPLFVVLVGIIALTFMLHLLIEVQGRYHFHITFLFCIIAGASVMARISDDSYPQKETTVSLR